MRVRRRCVQAHEFLHYQGRCLSGKCSETISRYPPWCNRNARQVSAVPVSWRQFKNKALESSSEVQKVVKEIMVSIGRSRLPSSTRRCRSQGTRLAILLWMGKDSDSKQCGKSAMTPPQRKRHTGPISLSLSGQANVYFHWASQSSTSF